MPQTIISKEESVLASTSWMQGFLDGREEGFKIGLKLGLTAAIGELERLIEKNKGIADQEVKLAEHQRDVEQRLAELGFVRKP